MLGALPFGLHYLLTDCAQDLEEVEEWNEYGELKDNVNLPSQAKATPATPAPSASNTPSKAPQAPPPPPSATDKPANTVSNTSAALSETATTTIAAGASSEPSSTSGPASTSSGGGQAAQEAPPSTSAESTLTLAMRQAGFEAAKKAGDAKTKARAQALEASKAKSADLQKLDNSSPTGMPPRSGITEAEEAKKPDSGVTSADGAADAVPTAKEGEKEKATKGQTVAEGGEDKASTVAIDAHEAELLEGTGQAVLKEDLTPAESQLTSSAKEPEDCAAISEPQPIPSAKEAEKSAPKTEPQHIPNAKEAEEEANKAIIADESSHVHIAGSPPPHASPGAKYPRDEPGEVVTAGSRTTEEALNEREMTEGTAAASSEGEVTKEEDETGKVYNVDTIEALPLTEAPATVEDETKANTGQHKTAASNEDSTAEPKIDALPLTKDPGEVPKPESEPAKTTGAVPTATHEEQDLPGTKTQEQPAASGKSAGESVAD